MVMAKTKGYDVWLTASNRVYRAVPYDVVADWLQQGRIVGGDRVRAEGGGNWDLVSASPLFATYLPPQDADRNLTQEQVLARLDAKIKEFASSFGISVRVAAHKQTPFGTVQALTAELEKRRGPGRINEIKAEMNERSK